MGDAEEERHTQGVPNAFLPLTIQLPRQMGGSPTALSRTQSATAGGWPSRFPSGMPAATLATRPCEGSATVCRPRGPVTPTSFAPGCMSPRIFPPSGAPPDLPLHRAVRAWWTKGSGSQSGTIQLGMGVDDRTGRPELRLNPRACIGNSEETTCLRSRRSYHSGTGKWKETSSRRSRPPCLAKAYH